MKKIDYTVIRNKNCVAFAITYMDERFRCINEVRKFQAKNGLTIKSHCFPYLKEEAIYLRGTDRDLDCEIDVKSFDNEKEAKEYVEKLHEALKDWAENWEGWNAENEKEETGELKIERKVF